MSLGDHFKINKDKLISDSKVVFKGINYRITVLSDRLIRFEYSIDGKFNDNETEIVHNRVFDIPKIKVDQDNKYIVITTKYFIMQYAKEKPFKGPSFAPDTNLKVKLINTDKVWYYSHPEARNFKGSAKSIEDFLNKTELKNGLYSTDGFAVLDDSSSMILDDEGYLIPSQDKKVDLYLFAYRRDFGLCLKDYFTLTGYPPIPPRYALGLWWNRDKIYNAEDIKKLVGEFNKNEIPLSVLLLSEFWHQKDSKNYNLYKTGYTFNKELFRNPTDLTKYLHDRSVKIGLNIDGIDGINNLNDGYTNMCQELNFEMGKVIPFRMLDKNFVDAYFRYLIRPLYTLGIDFFWLDSKDDVNLRTLNYYHFNDYKQFKDKRGMILSRNSLKSSHLYPIHYSGELTVSWEALNYLPFYNSTASNIGLSWWSHDVGGFKNGVEDNELYLRWVQFGTFSPIFRFSSKRGAYYKREPWRWDIKTFTIVKDYIHLRHRLIPYLYTEAYKYHNSGLPIIEPLYYNNPELVDDVEYKNEYYFGSELLISPITKPKDDIMDRSIEKIFLPKGIWYDFKSGKKYVGNKRYITFYKDEDYPIFAKSGSIIPLSILKDNINDTSAPKDMEIQVFPGKSSTYRLYEDDGYSSLYEEGYYIITSILFNYLKDNYTLEIQPIEGKTNIIPDERNYKIRFRNTRLPEKIIVTINNKEVNNFIYYSVDNDLILEIKNVDTKKHLVINLMGNNIEIDAYHIINEDINDIISNLKIETILKELIAGIIFSGMPMDRKRIEIRKLNKKGLDNIYVQMFLRLLEYINEI